MHCVAVVLIQNAVKYKHLFPSHCCRWFCFFDDDIYVNVPALVTELQQYDPLKDRVYLGHYPDKWLPGEKVCTQGTQLNKVHKHTIREIHDFV